MLNGRPSSVSDIDAALSEVSKGKISTLTESAGGRKVHVVTYGEDSVSTGRANYSSACGAGDVGHYRGSAGELPPTVLFIGGVHGGEPEGVAGILELIKVMETGTDFQGVGRDEIVNSLSGTRLLLVPSLNPDGRARFPFRGCVGMPLPEFRYYAQGTWLDGSLCGWPDCKAVHPIKDATDYLGAYFNDDGVNFMHDDFFNPMAAEVRELLRLVADEKPSVAINLHGGANTVNQFVPPSYVPAQTIAASSRLNTNLAVASNNAGLRFEEREMGRPVQADLVTSADEHGTPPSFNLTSAIHHACGGVSLTYETNQGLDVAGAPIFAESEIAESHLVLFHEVLNFVSQDK